MKKILAAIIAAAMILTLCVVPALADGEVVFSADNVTAAPGEDVQVALNIAGEFEAHDINLQFNYNSEKLSVVSVAFGEVITAIQQNSGTSILDHTTIPGSIRWGVMMPMDPVSTDGVAFTITFHVSEECEGGEVLPLEIVISEFYYMPGSEPTPIPFVIENGSITVEGGETPTEVPPTEVPPTEVPPTDEPTEVPSEAPSEEPTEAPSEEPTEAPSDEPTDAPSEEPTEAPTEDPGPTPPPTGAIALVGAGVAAITAGAGIVLFRKKED